MSQRILNAFSIKQCCISNAQTAGQMISTLRRSLRIVRLPLASRVINGTLLSRCKINADGTCIPSLNTFLDTLEHQKENVIQWFAKTLKQMKRWLDENKNKLLTLRHICIFAARSNKKVNWTKKTTLNPKPEDLTVPPAL